VRSLLLSDIHANWYALEAVLKEAKGLYQHIYCCGDLVGYNPHPAKVMDWAKLNCDAIIRGNHDKVVAGLDNLEWFNEVAQIAARWTISQLNSEQIKFLQQLPQGPLTIDSFQLWHGSPRDEDEYVTSPREAIPCFPYVELPLAFFGHTHLQGGFFSRHSKVGSIPVLKSSEREVVIELQPDTMFMINPGSVGQPRDGDPRAAYALYDSEQRTVTLRRVEYPAQKTMEEIRAAGLPDVLGQRLFCGL
jgi:predicted phosphodiesterase